MSISLRRSVRATSRSLRSLDVDELRESLLQAPAHGTSVIGSERYRGDVEARPVVALEQSRHQVRNGMVAEIPREVSHADPVVSVALAGPQWRRRGRALVGGVGARVLQVGGRGCGTGDEDEWSDRLPADRHVAGDSFGAPARFLPCAAVHLAAEQIPDRIVVIGCALDQPDKRRGRILVTAQRVQDQAAVEAGRQPVRDRASMRDRNWPAPPRVAQAAAARCRDCGRIPPTPGPAKGHARSSRAPRRDGPAPAARGPGCTALRRSPAAATRRRHSWPAPRRAAAGRTAHCLDW